MEVLIEWKIIKNYLRIAQQKNYGLFKRFLLQILTGYVKYDTTAVISLYSKQDFENWNKNFGGNTLCNILAMT